MLKVRIIPTMLWNGTTLVKGNKFENNKRSAGSPLTTIKIYNSRDVDEIFFFDISRNNKIIDKDFILSITDSVSVPITIGGGIEKISQMNDLFEYGADKIAINSIVFKDPNIINESSKRFGSQAITVSIDVKKSSQKYECYYNLGRIKSDREFKDFITECVDRGAGEIVINCIDHDGLMKGYDNNLIQLASSLVNVPIVASGGAGNYEHFHEAYKKGADAFAAASIYHFTQHTPAEAKKYLLNKGVPIRENFII
jgi:imidazole glycerol-phosphate synthase subunit HisF